MSEQSPDQSQMAWSEAQQQALLDFAVSQSSAIFYIADMSGDSPVRFISSNVESITGHRPADFLSQADFGRQHLHPDDHDGYRKSVELLKEQGALTHDYRFATASGEYRWFRDEIRLVDGYGTANEFVGCMTDITERVVAEQERQRLARLLHDAVESMPNGFAIYDPEGRLVLTNNALALPASDKTRPSALVGLSRKEVLLRLLPNFKSFDGQEVQATEACAAEIDQRLQELRSGSVEIELAEDGWRLLSCYPTSEGGQVVASVNITQLKEAATALHESERQFRSIVEGNPSPVRVSEFGTWKILYESPAAAALFGRSWPSDLTQSTIAAYVDEEARQAIIRELAETDGVDQREVLMRRVDGTTFWAALSARVIGSQGKRVCVTSLVDLTEQKARQDELRRAHEVMEDALESLSEGFALFDADHKFVMCNSRFREFNRKSADLLVPGADWMDVNRVAVERGQYPQARGRETQWLEDLASLYGKEIQRTFEQDDGRWFEYSHRVTRQNGLTVTSREITEHLAMEEALRESEALVRRILEACPLPVRMWNPASGKVIYESPACQALFGVNATAQAPYERLSVYADPEDRKTYLAKLRATGYVDNHEIKLNRRDGTTFWASVSARITDFKGDQVVVSSIVDLTEHKQREAEVQHAREILEDAIESLPEGFALFDRDDTIVLCNSRFREFNELSADALVPGAKWIDFVQRGVERGQYIDAQDNPEQWLRERRRLHSLGTGQSGGVEFQQSDGRWYHGFSQATREGGYVGIRIDITERKEMELALRESEGLVRRVLEACPAPITMSRLDDGLVIYETPAVLGLFGYESTQESATTISRWASAEDRAAYAERLRRNGKADDYQASFRRANGEELWCSLSSRVIDYGGEAVIVTSLYDLTERREAEAELRRQRERLHQSEKLSALGELLAGVSHELNNPLSVLVGQALMLQETAPDKKIASRAEKIGKAADRCARIVKTFLAMARQEPSKKEPIDLDEVIEAALEMTAYSLHSAGIEISRRMAKNLPIIMADADQMGQVVTNLIVNAQHSMQSMDGPRKLRIITSYRKKTNTVVVKVKDNGPGIPEEIRSRIFEPLYTTKQVGSGTGMGLALCHRIVEAHGGNIVVESQPGEGAAFAIRLPCGEGCEAQDIGGPAEDVARKRYKILVVDDEYDVGQIISEILQHDGHDVQIAGSGKVALSKIERGDFDVILSDLRMPEMDGPDFFRALNDSRPEMVLRLAFITGDTLSPGIRDFLRGCGRPYLEKPILPKDVRGIVDRIVAARLH